MNNHVEVESESESKQISKNLINLIVNQYEETSRSVKELKLEYDSNIGRANKKIDDLLEIINGFGNELIKNSQDFQEISDPKFKEL